MRIGIIGAGFTGLSAAYYLSKHGHTVTVIEKDSKPGGLALGFKETQWDWTLEQHYHHWFTNDDSILNLAKELAYDVEIKRPKTSVYVNDTAFQLDSPLHVLRFPQLSFFENLRMATVLGVLKYSPIWKPLEKYNAATVLPILMGKKAYSMLWEPQLINKFGSYHSDISLAWFWARIHKRTSSLAYPKKGYLAFAKHIVKTLEKQKTKVLFNQDVQKLTSNKKECKITINKNEELIFDRVIVTVPVFTFLKISPQLPDSYKKRLTNLKGLGAINLVLRLKKQFLKDNTYWLSICKKNALVMAIVEHTNFMNKKHYNNEHIVYLGNYVSPTSNLFHKSANELLSLYDPLLKQINKTYKQNIIGKQVFKAPFAQPIIPTNYSKSVPPFKTPLRNVYLANMQQVYPWDRGTNYAVSIGKTIAEIIMNRYNK